MRHSQNFDKIDSFLESALDICIFGNVIVGWGERVIKEGAGILHQIYKFSGDVNICKSRIHQSKSWYYRVGSTWTLSNIQGGIFYRNCFRLKAINFFCKKFQLRCLTGSIRLFEKHFYVLLVKILHLEK